MRAVGRYGRLVSAPLARLPGGASDGDAKVPPVDLYRIAVEEYRFQAQFNWSRAQYLLAFNVGILAAATAVASRPGSGAALVFALGALAAVLSMLVVRVQHGTTVRLVATCNGLRTRRESRRDSDSTRLRLSGVGPARSA